MSYTYYRVQVKRKYLTSNEELYKYYRIKDDKRFKILRKYNVEYDYFYSCNWRGINQIVSFAKWYESHIKITEEEFKKYLLIDKIRK